MKTKISLITTLLLLSFAIVSCTQKKEGKKQKYTDKQTSVPIEMKMEPVSADHVNDRLNIYAPFELSADLSHLSENEVRIIGIFYEVARIMDGLFWKQTIGNKSAFLAQISDTVTWRFAKINYGPWDRLDNNKPFIAGIGEKPKGANFYPPDMTKEEFDAFDDPNKKSL